MNENKICVYAICKNESAFVDRWLDSMKEADYIVVLDTGSDDNTYELLKNDSRVFRAEQKVIKPWRFDVARNESLKLVPEDANILVCTDLDEILEPGWAKVLRERWQEGFHERAVYKFAWSHNENGEPGRIFQYDKVHNKDWIWKHPVHELLVRKNDTKDGNYSNYLYLFDDMYLHHYPDMTKSRGTYLPLLELRKQEDPEDYYGKIYLAHEYYYRGFFQKSINELQDILDNYSDKYNEIERASCYLFMGDSYRELGQLDVAIGCYYKAMMVDDSYREPYINLAEVLNRLNYYNQAIGVVKDCLQKTFRHYNWLERDTTWTYEPYDILAIAYYYTEQYDLAYSNINKALRYSPNDERLLYNLSFINEKVFE